MASKPSILFDPSGDRGDKTGSFVPGLGVLRATLMRTGFRDSRTREKFLSVLFAEMRRWSGFRVGGCRKELFRRARERISELLAPRRPSKRSPGPWILLGHIDGDAGRVIGGLALNLGAQARNVMIISPLQASCLDVSNAKCSRDAVRNVQVVNASRTPETIGTLIDGASRQDATVVIDMASRPRDLAACARFVSEIGRRYAHAHALVVWDADSGRRRCRGPENWKSVPRLDSVAVVGYEPARFPATALEARLTCGLPLRLLTLREEYSTLDVWNPEELAGAMLSKTGMSLEEVHWDQVEYAEYLGSRNCRGRSSDPLKWRPERRARSFISKTPDRHILRLLTEAERRAPELLAARRLKRVASELGCSVRQVRNSLQRLQEQMALAMMLDFPIKHGWVHRSLT